MTHTESPPSPVRTEPAAESRAARPAGDHDPSARRRGGLIAGAVAFAAVLLAPMPEMVPVEAQRTAAVALLMAVWWMTEALPLAATSLIPLALFPFLGVLAPDAAAAPYANPVIFLFMGGFLLALAMERWGLHRRIALGVVGRIGAGPRRLILGFMVATALVSMWVSNTATAAMMLPIGIALTHLLRPKDPAAPFPFGTALMLGIAYSASIGGLATLIGTPPNVVFAAAASELLGREIGFLEWMALGVPLAAVFLPLAWALLVHVLFRPGPLPDGAEALLSSERDSLGPMKPGERITLIVFGLTVLGWLLRQPKTIGGFTIPGLATIAPGIHDGTIAIAGALLLFLLPAGRGGPAVLDWDTAKRLPWGVLLLFGGGLSLARAFEASGLTQVVAEMVGGMGGVPAWALIGVVCATFLLLSELASNTATASMAMPVLAAAAAGLAQDPIVFMAVGALASSAAFMMPVATPPNAIAFGTGHISIRQMARAGVWLNLASLFLVTLVGYFVVGWVLG